MPLKIWSIGKANARIEELEAQAAALTKERDEARAALETNGSEVSAAATQLQADHATAKHTIGTLQAANQKLVEQVAGKDAELAALNAKVAGQAEQVKVQVAAGLATQQAALGQPPIPSPASAVAGKSTEKLTGMARVLAGAKSDLEAAGYVRKN